MSAKFTPFDAALDAAQYFSHNAAFWPTLVATKLLALDSAFKSAKRRAKFAAQWMPYDATLIGSKCPTFCDSLVSAIAAAFCLSVGTAFRNSVATTHICAIHTT